MRGDKMYSIKRDGEYFNVEKKRWEGAVYVCHSLVEADLIDTDLRGAYLSGIDLTLADLRDADLTDSDLSGANLSAADLRGACLRNANLGWANLNHVKLDRAYLGGAVLTGIAVGNNAEIKTIQLGHYQIVICGEVMAVGCQQHSIEKWLSFSDDDICMMDYDKSNDFLLDYYHKKLLPLLQIIRG